MCSPNETLKVSVYHHFKSKISQEVISENLIYAYRSMFHLPCFSLDRAYIIGVYEYSIKIVLSFLHVNDIV